MEGRGGMEGKLRGAVTSGSLLLMPIKPQVIKPQADKPEADKWSTAYCLLFAASLTATYYPLPTSHYPLPTASYTTAPPPTTGYGLRTCSGRRRGRLWATARAVLLG